MKKTDVFDEVDTYTNRGSIYDGDKRTFNPPILDESCSGDLKYLSPSQRTRLFREARELMRQSKTKDKPQ